MGLWSVLHSSAFDDHHSIPTTADITRSAHKTASLGSRVFPSNGLTTHQLAEAIKENHLAPIVLHGDSGKRIPLVNKPGFSRSYFASSCAAFIRSGYPILLGGLLENCGPHAVCAVGFREPTIPHSTHSAVELADGYVEHVYIHDDNLGPSVRFRIEENPTNQVAVLVADPPPPRNGGNAQGPTVTYDRFLPCEIIAAVHDNLRLSPDALFDFGRDVARGLYDVAKQSRTATGQPPPESIWYSARFLKLSRYLSDELPKAALMQSKIVAAARLALCERIAPMSLHIGVVRIALSGADPIVDFLFDTTDGDRDPQIYAHVCYQPEIDRLVHAVASSWNMNLGMPIKAF
ncbi:MAG: hypothetical protein K2Y51_26785 [Gammaproteobacteria bacterium]|nr:hypothetical protein [Gammaproteobacteria bacterium]